MFSCLLSEDEQIRIALSRSLQDVRSPCMLSGKEQLHIAMSRSHHDVSYRPPSPDVTNERESSQELRLQQPKPPYNLFSLHSRSPPFPEPARSIGSIPEGRCLHRKPAYMNYSEVDCPPLEPSRKRPLASSSSHGTSTDSSGSSSEDGFHNPCASKRGRLSVSPRDTDAASEATRQSEEKYHVTQQQGLKMKFQPCAEDDTATNDVSCHGRKVPVKIESSGDDLATQGTSDAQTDSTSFKTEPIATPCVKSTESEPDSQDIAHKESVAVIENRLLFRNWWPIYSEKRTSYDSTDAAAALFQPHPMCVCDSVPKRCVEHKAFILDLCKIADREKITADGNGKFERPYIKKCRLAYLNGKFKYASEGEYTLTRRCYSHSSIPYFRRFIFHLIDANDNVQRFAMLQYFYSGGNVGEAQHRCAMCM